MLKPLTSTLTIPEIKETWEYEKETGLFRWKIGGRGIPRGAVTGHSDGRYLILSRKKEGFYAHRVAFAIVLDEWPECVDHINGDKLDNRWINLRQATQAQNLRNKAVKGDSLTRVKGVTRDKRDGRFYAYIDVDGRRMALGGFDTAEQASVARRAAEKIYHDGFAYNG